MDRLFRQESGRAVAAPGEPEAAGLPALMLLQDSRRDARTGPGGELLLLESRDRSLRDREQIEAGTALLRSLPLGPHALQAAIAAAHANAPTAADTDWTRIAGPYGVLLRLAPGRADLLRRRGRDVEADTAYRRALELSTQPAERQFPIGRLAR